MVACFRNILHLCSTVNVIRNCRKALKEYSQNFHTSWSALSVLTRRRSSVVVIATMLRDSWSGVRIPKPLISQLISFAFKSVCFLFFALCSFQFSLQLKCSPRYFTYILPVVALFGWCLLRGSCLSWG
jgi:hypothetical protein